MFESDHFQSQPLYVRLRDLIDERMRMGLWHVGTRLPSEQELAEELGTDATAVHAALDVMDEEHLVARQNAGATFVTGYVPLDAPNGRETGPIEFKARLAFARCLVRLLSWAAHEAMEVLYDDVAAKHLEAASERLRSRFAIDTTDRPL